MKKKGFRIRLRTTTTTTALIADAAGALFFRSQDDNEKKKDTHNNFFITSWCSLSVIPRNHRHATISPAFLRLSINVCNSTSPSFLSVLLIRARHLLTFRADFQRRDGYLRPRLFWRFFLAFIYQGQQRVPLASSCRWQTDEKRTRQTFQ